jgi:methionyl aminopeptidase
LIRLKTEAEIQAIWVSGQIGCGLLDSFAGILRPGLTTGSLDEYAREYLSKNNARPAFLGYNGFSGAICTSMNEQVVHGIPGKRVINDGDLITIDVGTEFDGMISDTAKTYYVGSKPIPASTQRLVDSTHLSLSQGISAAGAGQPLRLISRAIQGVLVAANLSIIKELTGHGVGFAVHEEPTVYNFDPGGRKPFLVSGMVIAVEPMAALGKPDIVLAGDQWTYLTADGSLSAHFEHTIACLGDEIFNLTDARDARARERFGNGKPVSLVYPEFAA